MTLEQIKEKLNNTKVYVNGKLPEIERVLIKFGYSRPGYRSTAEEKHHPFLFICENGIIYGESSMPMFKARDFKEITAEEILSMDSEAPTCRPFRSMRECWDEMTKHNPLGWIMREDGTIHQIVMIGEGYIQIGWKNTVIPFTPKVGDTFTFMDGTPFGIKV